MSIKVLKVREPRLDIEPDRTYIAMMGGSHVTTKSYNADTANNSQIIWSITTPSVRVGLDRRIECEFSVDVTCGTGVGDALAPLNTGVGGNNPDAWSSLVNVGPRQYPLHSIIEVLNCRLNDQAFSYEPSRLIHALMRYGNEVEDRQHFMGSTPHKPDVATSYSINDVNVGNRNPFISYFNSAEEDSRNMRYWCSRVDANTFRITVLETLMVSPFYWGKADYQCLFGIQNFDLSLTLSNVARVFSGALQAIGKNAVGDPDNANAIFPTGLNSLLTFKVREDTVQKLHMTFITPQPDQEIPRLLHYPYYQIKRFTQNGPTLTPQASASGLTFNNITLHEIPKRMYIFCKPNVINNDITQADYFTSIEKITINFDNQDGRLSTLDSFDLWKLSAKNGCKMSYVAYNKVIGSVLCIEFGTDLNLNPLLCAGVRGNFQYSATIEVKDVRPVYPNGGNVADVTPVVYSLYTIMVPEGVLTVDDQLVSISIGTLTEEIVAQAPFAPTGFRHEVKNYYGGGMWSNLWSGIKKVFKVGAPIARDIAGAVGSIAGLIPHPSAQGIGMGANAINKVLGQVAGQGRRRPAGGARMRTSSLAHRL